MNPIRQVQALGRANKQQVFQGRDWPQARAAWGTAVASSWNPPQSLCRPGQWPGEDRTGLQAAAATRPDLSRMKATGGNRPGIGGAGPSPSDPATPRTHLILIGLLLAADGDVAGTHEHVHLVVTGNAPAAVPGRADPLELQLGVPARLPLVPGRGQREHPAEQVHRPQCRAGHGPGGCGERGRRVRSVGTAASDPGPGDHLARQGNPR